jgi:hypothetical protein
MFARMRRSASVALLLLSTAPATAGAVDPELTVGGTGSKWIY